MINKEKVIALLMLLLIIVPSLSIAEVAGVANIGYDSSEEEQGGVVSTRQNTRKSIITSISRDITELISYSISLRGDMTDTDSDNGDGIIATTTQATYVPAIDFSLGNRMYDMGVGLSHRVQNNSSSSQADTVKTTTDIVYGSFDVRPENLPSLTAVYTTETKSDNMSLQDKNSNYIMTTNYLLPSPDLEFTTNLSYVHSISETPSSTTRKSVSDSYSGNYRFAKSRNFWGSRVFVNAGYSGNFSSSESKASTDSTGGSVLFERTRLGGLYAQGTLAQPDVDILASHVTLVNNNYTVSTGINLSSASTDEYQNIGVWVSPDSSVDRLYIYVNRDVTGDTSLTLRGNWKVYWSDFNLPGTWTELTLSPGNINVEVFDAVNNIYRYEITFLSDRSARYFKAVNMDVASLSGVSVTEIEAWGTEDVSSSGEISSSSKSISQRIEFFSNLTPMKKLQFTLSYSIDKSDQNPSSITGSFTSLLTSMLSKSKSGEDDPFFSSAITKNYGISTTWYAHRFFTARLRFQLNQAYDNEFKTDTGSQSYSLALASSPIDTLATNLTFTRSESFQFETKDTVSDSVIFSVGAELYRNVDIVTDIGFSRTQSFSDNTEATSTYISGAIDTTLTRELAGTLRYNYNMKSSDTENTTSLTSSLNITYRPGRFINFTSELDYAKSEDVTTMSGLLIAGWRPLPVLQISCNLSHSSTTPDDLTEDSFYLTGAWQVKKFMNVSMAARFDQEGEDSAESINAAMSLKF